MCLKSIEFRTTPKGVVMVEKEGQDPFELSQGSPFVEEALDYIQEFYTEAHEDLKEAYKQYRGTGAFYDFLRVRRFVKCNFGEHDNIHDLDTERGAHFEFVHCPLRGECKYENRICNPKFNSTLSPRVLEVMKHCYEGRTDSEIADLLCISIFTVENHRKSAFRKLNIHSMAEFNRFAASTNLFKQL